MRQKELKDTSRSMTLPVSFLFFFFQFLHPSFDENVFIGGEKLFREKQHRVLIIFRSTGKVTFFCFFFFKARASFVRTCRCQWIVSSNDDTADDQFYSRFCECCCFRWNEKVEVAYEFSSIKRCKIFNFISWTKSELDVCVASVIWKLDVIEKKK